MNTSIETLKKLLLNGDERAVVRRAKRVGTTPAYLYKLACGHGLPSLDLLGRLVKEVPSLRTEMFLRAKEERMKIGRQRPYKPRKRAEDCPH